MSDVHPLMTASGCHLYSGCGYPAPDISDFYFKPLFTIGGIQFTKPMALAIFAALLVLAFFWAAFAKPKLVPRGVQNLGEMGMLLVRDQILRPTMGKKGDRFLPFLIALFFFVWVNNIFGVIPGIQFPTMSRYAFPVALALMVWGTYIFLGMKHQGPLGYFKNMAVPQGAPWWILPLLSPIELLSNIFIRPFTLSIRLFANMMAGHLLLVVFALASWYLLTFSHYGVSLAFSGVSFILTVILTGLEVLIQLLQAFIFTILTASYIAGSLEAAH